MMMDRELIIQKCYAIVGWARERGQATLNQDKPKFEKADLQLKLLIDKLCKVIKDE